MKNLLIRSLSGSVYVLLIITSIVLGKFYFFSLLFVIHILALYEFYSLFKSTNKSPDLYTGIFASLIIFVVILISRYDFIPDNRIYYLFLLPVILLIKGLFTHKNDHLLNMSSSFFGIIYVTLPLLLFCFLADSKQSASGSVSFIILATYILIWTSDTFGYLVGITMGKHKLIPEISPKKSWEGLIGGILFTILVAYFLSYFSADLNKTQWVILGFLVSVFSTIGDLIESKFKRSANVKDSGKLIPGHGGILDRIDSLLIVAPIVYVYLNIIN